MKKYIYLLIISLFAHPSKAQQSNTQVTIRYTPSLADVYKHSYASDTTYLSGLLQLTTLENYLDYRPLEAADPIQVSKNTLTTDYRFRFTTAQPGIYYLLSKDRNPYLEQAPIRMVWLGKGTHTLDVYSILENDERINESYYQPYYRVYYDGTYTQENRFLEQLAQATRRHQDHAQQPFKDLAQHYGVYDSSETYRRELAGKYTSEEKQSAYFANVDSTVQSLNLLYATLFPKPNPAFDAIIKPELRNFGYSCKLSYLVSMLALHNALQVEVAPDAQVLPLVRQLTAELDKQPLQLSVSSYRSSYVSIVFLKNWLQTKRNSAEATDVFIQTLATITEQEFKTRPQLCEYLRAALVDYYISYLLYSDAEDAEKILSDFVRSYPKSSYRVLLDQKFQKKKEKLQAEKSQESRYDYNNTDSTSVVDPVSAPPPADIADASISEKKEVTFWKYKLYTADGNTTDLSRFKGKNTAIRALSGCCRISYRDLAYFQFLEKKFRDVQFVYIVLGSPVEAQTEQLTKVRLKGKFLYTNPVALPDYEENLTEQVPSAEDIDFAKAPPPKPFDEDWYRCLQYPYWHLVDKQGLMHRPYISDDIDDELAKWLRK